MPVCNTDDKRPEQDGDPAAESHDDFGSVQEQSERITAVALAYQAEQRAKGREISLTTAIIEIVTLKDH